MAIEQTDGATVFTGDDVYVYAFITLLHACRFRAKHGMSLYRNQELKMAHNYGWSEKRTIKGVLADLELIHDQMPQKEN